MELRKGVFNALNQHAPNKITVQISTGERKELDDPKQSQQQVKSGKSKTFHLFVILIAKLKAAVLTTSSLTDLEFHFANNNYSEREQETRMVFALL